VRLALKLVIHDDEDRNRLGLVDIDEGGRMGNTRACINRGSHNRHHAHHLWGFCPWPHFVFQLQVFVYRIECVGRSRSWQS
jgi:hypothetical protein